MTDTEPTEASILELAQAFDAGKDIDTPATPEVPDDKQAQEPKDKIEEVKQPKEEKSAEASKESEAKEPKDTEPKAKSKWAQNDERKSKTWQEINAEKEAIKAEKEALAREKEALQKSKVTTEQLRDEHGVTAKDYREVAKQLRAKGENAQADAAEQLANNLDQKEQSLKQQRAVEEMQAAWSKSYNELSEKKPDLKDQNSELYKGTVAILNEHKLLAQSPDGLKYAVRAAEIELQAKAFDGTKAELAKLKSDYEKLQKKLSIGSGVPTAPLEAQKSFNEMSLKEQEKWLEQASQESDRARGFE